MITLFNFWMFFTPVRLTFMIEKTANFPYPNFPGKIKKKKNTLVDVTRKVFIEEFLSFLLSYNTFQEQPLRSRCSWFLPSIFLTVV